MAVGRKPEIFESTRIPLIGVHNTRQATAGVVINKDQRFVNFFPMKLENPVTGKETYYLVKRPGFEPFLTPSTPQLGTALHIWETGTGTVQADILSAFGSSHSTIYKDIVSLGTITGQARSFHEVDFTGASTVVIPSSDSTAWYYPLSGSLTKITDVDYPGNASRPTVGNFVSLDGYLFIMDSSGRIYNSDLNSITAWTSTAFTAPTYYTGRGVGLARHHDSIVAFTSSSVEFYTNEGATPSPLQRREMVVTPIGGVVPGGTWSTITQIREKVFFVGTHASGGVSIYKIEKYGFQKISTQAIDQQMEVSEPINCGLTTARIWGMDVLLLGAGSNSFFYLPELNIWGEMGTNTGSQVLWGVCASSSKGDGQVYSIATSAAVGKIFRWNTDTPVYQDNSLAYAASARTSLVDFGTEKRKRLHKLKVIGDKQASTTTIGITWSDDDYNTSSTTRNVDMSSNRAYLSQCGMFRRRSFTLINSTNTPCRLEALELDYSECKS